MKSKEKKKKKIVKKKISFLAFSFIILKAANVLWLALSVTNIHKAKPGLITFLCWWWQRKTSNETKMYGE